MSKIEKRYPSWVYLVLSESEWLGTLLAKNLTHMKQCKSICVLAVGEGLELLHLRWLSNSRTKIFAFDIRNGDYTKTTSDAVEASFYLEDLRNIERIIEIMGGSVPDIVVCRHPEVFQFDEEGNVTGTNWGQIDALANWGKLVSDAGKQLLIINPIREERNLIIDKMRRLDLRPIVEENPDFPKAFPQVTIRDEFRSDSYTIKIG